MLHHRALRLPQHCVRVMEYGRDCGNCKANLICGSEREMLKRLALTATRSEAVVLDTLFHRSLMSICRSSLH